MGKTLRKGLAGRLAEGDVPERGLKGVTLLTLDVGALVAGAKYRGEFEERLRAILDEVKQVQGIIDKVEKAHPRVSRRFYCRFWMRGD